MRLYNYLKEYTIEELNEQLNEGVFDPAIFRAVILAGGPGSGKSFIAKQTTLGHGFKLVNSDEAFEFLMKKMNLDMSAASSYPEIRHHAKDMTSKKLLNYINGRLGLVIDGTGKNYNKIAKQRTMLLSLGYDVMMIFVNTSLEVALQRNAERARKVDPEVAKSIWLGVQENIGKFQNLFGANNFIVIDNSDPSETQKEIFNKVWKHVMKFAKSPIKNPIAKGWINQALEKRRRE